MMGKSKQFKKDLSSLSTAASAASPSFSRMNFLYQASLLASNLPGNNSLTCYYARLMKEIAMKMVEKVHPDIKRTICSACNHSLTGSSKLLNVKIKCHPKRRKKIKLSTNVLSEDTKKNFNSGPKSDNVAGLKYKKSRIDVKTKRPNKIYYTCEKCFSTKNYLQKPTYSIQINKLNDSS